MLKLRDASCVFSVIKQNIAYSYVILTDLMPLMGWIRIKTKGAHRVYGHCGKFVSSLNREKLLYEFVV